MIIREKFYLDSSELRIITFRGWLSYRVILLLLSQFASDFYFELRLLLFFKEYCLTFRNL